jgi:osmotically-inducible protein OsmY
MERNLSDPKDVELEASISRVIRHRGMGLHVSVRSGVIFLSGAVDDFETKRDIDSSVRSVAGGHTIHNNIRVARVTDM